MEPPSASRLPRLRPRPCGLNRQACVRESDRIVYIENLKDSTKKLVILITEFSKVAGCKINIKKSVAFIYMNNELSGELRKPSLLQLHKKYIIPRTMDI